MLSIWEQRSFHGEPDLLVVGAGITGLFSALHYKRRYPHERVLVLERGRHPSGASVKNAGFACFGSPSEILADIDAEGASVAVARVAERWAGLQELRAELGDANIGFEASGGHELYATDDPLYKRVAERFDELNKELSQVFGRSVYEWRDKALGDLGIAAEHLAFTPLEGPIDTGAMMRALIAKVQAAGVEVCFGQAALRVESDGRQGVLELSDGARIKARQVLLATNGYTRGLLPDVDVLPGRGQVVLTSPLPGLRIKGTFHLDEGFFYFRDLQSPEGPRILFGGGRNLDRAGEGTMEEGTSPLIQEALLRLLREVILPGRPFTIQHRWSGVMGFRSEGKSPLIEQVVPGVYVAAGLSGMGVAIGCRVARYAVELMEGVRASGGTA